MHGWNYWGETNPCYRNSNDKYNNNLQKEICFRVFSNKILKYCVNLISKPFTYICNSSLITGIYPDRISMHLYDTYKKGGKTNTSNYRSVTLLLSL